MQKQKIINSKMSMDQPPVGLLYKNLVNKRKSKDLTTNTKLLTAGESERALSSR